MNDEHYLTTADALTYLRTTPRTLYRHLAKGDIPAVRMGHQWRFRKSDLDRWVEDQSLRRTEKPAEPARRRRVLVADDEPAVCEMLTSVLAMSDFDTEAVGDGLQAVARLRAQEYDLLITDLRMPGLEGIEVAAEAKRLRPGIKVIIITGYPSQSSAIEAVNLGVDGYVVKPFRPVDVLIALARVSSLAAGATNDGTAPPAAPFASPLRGQT